MADESSRNPAPAATGASVPATPPTGPQGVVDAHGFVPTDFEWRPVPRRPRKDGWTPEVQQEFIRALARTGSVERACEEVNKSVRSAYDLRNAKEGEGFARAWAAVLTRAADRLLDVAFQQAIEGEEVPVHDQDGLRTGVKWKYNTRMAMFLLRAYHPERFRFADKEVRRADEPRPSATMPAPEAVASLAPVTPAEPHLLETSSTLARMVDRAEYEAARDGDPPAQGYRPVLVPPPHPAVVERARRNQARRRRGEDREDELYGPFQAALDEDDDGPEDRDRRLCWEDYRDDEQVDVSDHEEDEGHRGGEGDESDDHEENRA